MPLDGENVFWPGWKTVRPIGRGSFGAVYEIQRDILDNVEKAALKVISIPQNASDIDELYSSGYDEESITNTFKYHLRSIIEEYSMMRKLSDCPNIVTCDDVRYIQHDDGIGWDIYIKMELLTPLLKSLQYPVPEETVIKLAKDICSALIACKKYNIVHRDIKPQNIFLAPSGIFKLGDFGIAKTVEKTMGGTKVGTYNYMAPEIYNNQPYGSASDIYSLGLVLYWLLNERRMPFLPLPPAKLSAGQDTQARMRRLSGEQFPEPKYGSKQLKAIVMKACAYNAADRYASAADMLTDLTRIGQAQVIRTGAASVVSAPIEAPGDWAQPKENTVGLFTTVPNPSHAARVPSGAAFPEESNKNSANMPTGDETTGVFPVKGEPKAAKTASPDTHKEHVPVNIAPKKPENTPLDRNNQSFPRKEAPGGIANPPAAAKPQNNPLPFATQYVAPSHSPQKQSVSLQPPKKEQKKKNKILPIILISLVATIVISCVFVLLTRLLWTGLFNSYDDQHYSPSSDKKTGFTTIDNKQYYFDESGTMQTGWQTIGGYSYYFDDNGVMQTGFQTINGDKYYFNDDGTLYTGWFHVGSQQYYFSNSNGGKLATGKWRIDGGNYYFDEDGIMATGMVEITPNNVYHFDDDGQFMYCDITERDIINSTSEDPITFTDRSGGETWANFGILNTPMENVLSLQGELTIKELTSGNCDGQWQVHVRTQGGGTNEKWKYLGLFEVKNKTGRFTFNFEEPISFDAYACTRYESSVWSGKFHQDLIFVTYRTYDFGENVQTE